MTTENEAPATPRLRIPSQESVQQQQDPFQLLVTGYVVGALLHGGLDLSLITIEATTNDRRSAFVVESKTSRRRLRVSVMEVHDVQ